MIPSQLTLSEIQAAFRDVEARLGLFASAANIDLRGRRIIGAGQAEGIFDYVTKFEIDAQVAAILEELSQFVKKEAKTALSLDVFGDFLISGNYKFQSGTAFIATLDHAITAARTYTFPDASDTMVLLTLLQTLTNKKIGDQSDPTKAIAFTLSGATTAKTLTLISAHTADRSITFPDDTGTLVYQGAALTANNLILGAGTSKAAPLGSPGTTTTVLHGNAGGAPTFGAVSLTADVAGTLPVGNGGTGVAYDRVAATVALTAQTTTIGPTTIASAGSQFLFSYSLLDTAADLAAGSVQLTVNYTDDAGATSQASASLALTALGRTTGVLSIQRASGNVTYTVTLTGLIGTATYAIYGTLTRLS